MKRPTGIGLQGWKLWTAKLRATACMETTRKMFVQYGPGHPFFHRAKANYDSARRDVRVARARYDRILREKGWG